MTDVRILSQMDRIERKLDAEAAGREKLRDRLDRISAKLDRILEKV